MLRIGFDIKISANIYDLIAFLFIINNDWLK